MINGIDTYTQTAQYTQASSSRLDPKPQQDRADRDDIVTQAKPQSAPLETAKGTAGTSSEPRQTPRIQPEPSTSGGKDTAQKRGSLLDITV